MSPLRCRDEEGSGESGVYDNSSDQLTIEPFSKLAGKQCLLISARVCVRSLWTFIVLRSSRDEIGSVHLRLRLAVSNLVGKPRLCGPKWTVLCKSPMLSDEQDTDTVYDPN